MTKNAAYLFSARARITPDNIAISHPEGDLTYAALDSWSDALAADILARGDAYNLPLVVLVEDRRRAVAAIIAVLKAQAIFAPLDLRHPSNRIHAAIDVAEPVFMLCDAAGAARAAELGLDKTLRRIDIGDPRTGGAPDLARVEEEDEDAPAYIYFTSGSTGEPKGILGRLKAIGHFARWEAGAFGLDASVRCAQLTTPAFDAILRDIFTPLLVGGTICIPGARDIIADPAAFARWLDVEQVTLLHTTPSILRGLLRALAGGADVPRALRRVCVAGEVLPPVDAELFFDRFGDAAVLTNFYGPSETTMIKLFHEVTREDTRRHSIPIGKPISGARALVIDSRQQPCGIGMIGEIYIRTPFRSLGYYQRPDLNAERFVPNPLTQDPADIVYRTGDLGRMTEDGTLEFVGRKDRQVKIGGVRVEIADVENTLYRHHAVRDTVVVENRRPDGTAELAAYVVLSPEIPDTELRAFLGERLPADMIPAHFVAVPVLPRTVTGKVDFAALPSLAPRDTGPREYVEPATSVEIELAKIWRELMQIDTPSATANFFAVGGHSLLALQVLSRVEAAFAVNVALKDFLADPTIRGLATQIEAEVLAIENDDELLELLRDS
jgi:amino acid adenylation domain-containing protein